MKNQEFKMCVNVKCVSSYLIFVAGVTLKKESPDESNYDGIVDLVSEDDSVECMEVLMTEGAKQRVLLHRYFSKVICCLHQIHSLRHI